MRVLAISGSPSRPSKTVLALEAALARAASHPGVEVGLLDLRQQELVFCDGRDPEDYAGETRAAIDEVLAADALIVGTPVYRGGYTGRLKNLFDVLPNDAIVGKPVGLVATGGTDHHYLALEHELRPLIGFFRAWVVPGAVYANNSHFSAGRLVDDDVQLRLEQMADCVVAFAALGGAFPAALAPEIPRKSAREA